MGIPAAPTEQAPGHKDIAEGLGRAPRDWIPVDAPAAVPAKRGPGGAAAAAGGKAQVGDRGLLRRGIRVRRGSCGLLISTDSAARAGC